MGVDNLWTRLQGKCGKRVSLKSFVNEWLKANHRPLRVAIDGYKFVFESTHKSIPGKDKDNIMIENFMAKIWALIALNISFIIVFDGVYKPVKRDYSRASLGKSYEDDLEVFQAADCSHYAAGDSDIIKLLKQRLKVEKINFVQAPGEGEAQCAWMQQLGLVDYVITDDSDVFVFGATKVLKNFNRRHVDETKSSPKKGMDNTQYYVTPVDINKGEESGEFTLEKLIFLASLRGGDYSNGVGRIGIKYAILLALPSTSENATELKQELVNELQKVEGDDLEEVPEEKPVPNFADEFVDCFTDRIRTSLIHSWDMRLAEDVRKRRLREFSHRLSLYIRDHARKVFKRRFNLKKDIVIDEYATMHYMFPFINTSVFLFQPDSLNCCELEADCSSIQVPNNFLFQKFEAKPEENIIRENDNKTFDQVLCFKNRKIKQVITVSQTHPAVTHFPVPHSFTGNVKHVIFRLATDKSVPITITKDRTDDEFDECRLTCDATTVCERIPHCKEASKPLKNLQFSTWVLKSLVYMYLEDIHQAYENEKQQKEELKKQEYTRSSSPRRKRSKKFPTQKTTLDSLQSNLSLSKKTKTNVSSVSPEHKKPKRRSVAKREELPSGQRQIDSFFGKNTSTNKNEQQQQPDSTDLSDPIVPNQQNYNTPEENPFLEETTSRTNSPSQQHPNQTLSDSNYQLSSQPIDFSTMNHRATPIIDIADDDGDNEANDSNDVSLVEISKSAFELSRFPV